MIPKNAKRIPLRPLALGETTGHQHRLISEGGVALEDACELYEHTGDGLTQHFLRVTAEGVSLIHATEDSTATADHHRQPLAIGDHPVILERQMTDWGEQRATD